MDDLEALMSYLQMDDNAQAQGYGKGMANALRGRRAASELAVLSGNKRLNALGAQQAQGNQFNLGQFVDVGQQRNQSALQKMLQERSQAAAAQQQAAGFTHADASQAAGFDFQGRQNALNRAAELERAKIAAAAAGARQEALRPTGPQEVSPGYVTSPQIPIDKPEERAIRTAIASRAKLKGNTDRLAQLIEEHGSDVILDPGIRAEMQALESQILLEKKNIEALGAISGSDMDLMRGEVPKTTGLGGTFSSSKGQVEKLKALQRMADQGLDSTLGAMGVKGAPFSQPEQPASGQPVEPPKPPGGVKLLRSKKTGAMRWVDANGNPV